MVELIKCSRCPVKLIPAPGIQYCDNCEREEMKLRARAYGAALAALVIGRGGRVTISAGVMRDMIGKEPVFYQDQNGDYCFKVY